MSKSKLYNKPNHMNQGLLKSSIQMLDYFLVLDFEATCDNRIDLTPKEIIEIPVLKLNAKTLKVESIFHRYVKPLIHTQLTPFCTELTGIIQEQIESQDDFISTFRALNMWIEEECLMTKRFAFVTSGDWDITTMLVSQCQLSQIDIPPYFIDWINIKKSYADIQGQFPKGILAMLNGLGLEHNGQLHSGIGYIYNNH